MGKIKLETAQNPALLALVVSGIVKVEGGAVVWREGHLEHLAREWMRDPAATQRDYDNDLAVAREFSRERWLGLIGELGTTVDLRWNSSADNLEVLAVDTDEVRDEDKP